ncbi:MAG: phosphoribosylanthranilate isomerase [Ruminococcus sp.]
MTKIKLCGLRRMEDIEIANEISPDYVGFVFAKKSKRYVSAEEAFILRSNLKAGIVPVGVFVDEKAETIADLVKKNIIEAVQLHGSEDNEFIEKLRTLTDCTIIQAFVIKSDEDAAAANKSIADYILLDSGKGSGEVFDHGLIKDIERPYFLAGGLNSMNVQSAVEILHPFGVDASSSLETEGFKDKEKMTAFAVAVRKADKNND